MDGSTGAATYGYLADSGLLDHVSTDSGLITSYTYEDHRDVKTGVSNAFNTALASSYAYEYDAMGRRTSVANTGGAFAEPGFNRFAYNDRSEVTGSHRYLGTDLADASLPVDPETRVYAYDPIGNRRTATEGAETKTYTANDLNQYTIIANGAAVTLEYDADGNLVNRGGVAYTYNGENRLVAVAPENPASGDTKVSFVYDYQGRRAAKTVHQYSAGAWVEQSASAFLYDGWNLIEETTTANGTTSSKQWVWGLDLSQTLDGAGGVGGLLAMMDDGATYLYCYDANGNVGQLVNAADGSLAAHYEYDAFGRTLKAEGSMAQENPFRFSTKPLDAETGLYYYGYRYLDVELGRWLSRDPIGEDGGWNLYGFVGNSPLDEYDIVGLTYYIDYMGRMQPFEYDLNIAVSDIPVSQYLGWLFNSAFRPCGNCKEFDEKARRDNEEFHKIQNAANFWAKKYNSTWERYAKVFSWSQEKQEKFKSIVHSRYIENLKARDNWIVDENRAMLSKNKSDRSMFYAARCNERNCCNEGLKGWYCMRGTAVFGAGLDIASLSLVSSTGLAPGALITYGLSMLNTAVTVKICQQYASAIAGATASTASVSMEFDAVGEGLENILGKDIGRSSAKVMGKSFSVLSLSINLSAMDPLENFEDIYDLY